ncbi:erythromycin esterase family protein [Streptosporangium sp. CA-135522]|uniref:erythromycin esterase family protein n=1 Tax=Streptosporangium sp. CA-135522 TaxID=3240072 RepID=UPI003D8D6F82
MSSIRCPAAHAGPSIARSPRSADPAPGWLDARLAAAGPSASHWLDLRVADLRRQRDGPAKARVISGAYDPSRDAAEHLAVTSLPEAFDVLVHLCRVSPVRWLPA